MAEVSFITIADVLEPITWGWYHYKNVKGRYDFFGVLWEKSDIYIFL